MVGVVPGGGPYRPRRSDRRDRGRHAGTGRGRSPTIVRAQVLGEIQSTSGRKPAPPTRHRSCRGTGEHQPAGHPQTHGRELGPRRTSYFAATCAVVSVFEVAIPDAGLVHRRRRQGPGPGLAGPGHISALDTGRIYDRDLPALAQALADVSDALDRRPGWRLRTR